MQLSYNNQSLLATGCYEAEDPGLTRMGREVIAEMNRVGLVVDMSHSAERSTLEAMEVSARPIAITHANPAFWHAPKRNKSDTVLRALAETGGMLGFSLYPHHLKGGSDCTLADFCEMIARTAEVMGVERLGIGSDLCQDQPDSVVEWMRVGPLDQAGGLRRRLRRRAGLPAAAGILPRQPGFPRAARGLARRGVRLGRSGGYPRRQLAEVLRRKLREGPVSDLRDPDQVMRLARMGASHPTRLSFMRVLLRGLRRGGWRIERTEWEVDATGRGPRRLPRHGAGADLQPCRLRP
jgi:hypothetical protein